MKKFLKSPILWFVVGFGLALTGAIAYYEGWIEPLPAALEKTGSIEIREEGQHGIQTLRIDDLAEIRSIVDSVSYISTPQCKCDHTSTVTFLTADGVVKASICEHCLDFTFEGVTEHYRMTEPLLCALRHALESDKRQWGINLWKQGT